MLKTKNVVIGLVGLLASSAYAGGGIGNGGDAVICDGGKSVYLLDYVEGRGKDMKLTFMKHEKSQDSVRTHLERMMKRLRNRFDWRGFAYTEMAEEMLNDYENFRLSREGEEYFGKRIAFVYDNLPDVPDSQELSLPQSCTEKQQLVIQRQTSDIPEAQARIRDFKFNIPLLRRLEENSSFQVAMAIMHEILLWDQVEGGAKDSRMARYMNEHLNSDQFEVYDDCKWNEILKVANPTHKFGNGMISVFGTECDKSGEINGKILDPILHSQEDDKVVPKKHFGTYFGQLSAPNNVKLTQEGLNIKLSCKQNVVFLPISFLNFKGRNTIVGYSLARQGEQVDEYNLNHHCDVDVMAPRDGSETVINAKVTRFELDASNPFFKEYVRGFVRSFFVSADYSRRLDFKSWRLNININSYDDLMIPDVKKGSRKYFKLINQAIDTVQITSNENTIKRFKLESTLSDRWFLKEL